jgi:transposase
MTHDVELQKFSRLVVTLRERGASIRVIAKVFGLSKSTLHRWLPAIEAVAADCVPYGTSHQTEHKVAGSPVSQMGQTEASR